MFPSSKSQSLPSPVSFSLLMKKSAKSLTQISHSHLPTNTWPKLQQRIPIISQLLNATRLDTYFLHYLTSLLHGTFLPISSLRSKWTFMLVVPVGCPCSSYFKMFNYLSPQASISFPLPAVSDLVYFLDFNYYIKNSELWDLYLAWILPLSSDIVIQLTDKNVHVNVTNEYTLNKWKTELMNALPLRFPIVYSGTIHSF